MTIMVRSASFAISRMILRVWGNPCELARGSCPGKRPLPHGESLRVPERRQTILPKTQNSPRLLLRKRVGLIFHPEKPVQRIGINAAQMVALPATADEQQFFAAILFLHFLQTRRHFTNGGIPVDGFIRSVRFAPHRALEPVLAGLVVVQPGRLVAKVTLGMHTFLVALDLDQFPSVSTAGLDFQSAVYAAQDTCRLFEFRCSQLGTLPWQGFVIPRSYEPPGFVAVRPELAIRRV